MELSVLDPFDDYETAGYLRNVYEEKDLRIVGQLETASFEVEVHPALRFLRRLPQIQYEDIKTVHGLLFDSLYPWAGQDRLETAPHLRIVKAGYREMFALPDSIEIAANYALRLASDFAYMRAHPGEVFGYLAHAHPFLEGNGRTILTVYADLSRRAGFHVEWESIEKEAFLTALTRELHRPGSALDELVLRYAREGALSTAQVVARLRRNFQRE